MTDYFWIFETVIGLVFLVALQYGIKRLLRFVGRFERIMQPPITLVLWVIGIVYVVEVVGGHFGFSVGLGLLQAFRKAVFVSAFAWLIFRWKNEVQRALLDERKADATTVKMIGKLVAIATIVLAGLIILQTVGISTAPLLAFGSVGAASIGFAGKDVIANFCSGIMLHITRPFVIGDQILLTEKGLEGAVEEIGWFRTLIRDREKRAVYLPNNFFSTLLLVNISRMTHRRLKQALRIEFADVSKIPQLTAKIREMVEGYPTIDRTLPIQVHFEMFGDYGCHIGIDAYSTETDLQRFNAIQQDVLMNAQKALKELGVTVATPTVLLKHSS